MGDDNMSVQERTERRDYADYLRGIYGPGKVQKISINAGFSCPNRDGTIGTGGCIYCNNSSFTPSYCMNSRNDVKTQMDAGRKFFARKYPDMRYLAYFQSFSNTYGLKPALLRKLYDEALSLQGVVGMVIGTRPDTISDETIEILREINADKPVIVELGAETSSNEVLKIIRRGHSWNQTVEAVERIVDSGLHCGLHMIAGLPGESRARSLQSISDACKLPIDTIKLHQLQIIRDTPLCRQWQNGVLTVDIFELDEYVEFCCKALEIIPKSIVIERFLAQAPPEMVVAPKWGIKNYQFVHKLQNALKK